MTSLHAHLNVEFDYRVCFTRGAFDSGNLLLSETIAEHEGIRRAVVFFEKSLLPAHPGLAASIAEYAGVHGIELAEPPIATPGGEGVKNDREGLRKAVDVIVSAKLCRHSYVIGIGGGAMLDVVGFAAAVTHRGIRHIRFPTTTLAQADAGVGVKNGINYAGKKNILGAFAPPFAVINDFELLDGLPEERMRDGFVEAVKVALIRDAGFFAAMEKSAADLARFESRSLEDVIRRCAELHVRHIATSGDPFEMGTARPLDFGHWAAHKLEQISDFRISHGASVAAGIALDIIYSRRIGMLDSESAERALALLTKLGFEICPPEFRDRAGEILAGLEEFREHLGGELTITLLDAIGHGVEVHSMDRAEILASFRELADR